MSHEFNSPLNVILNGFDCTFFSFLLLNYNRLRRGRLFCEGEIIVGMVVRP